MQHSLRTGWSCSRGCRNGQGVTVHCVTNNDQFIRFDAQKPEVVITLGPVGGMQPLFIG